MRIGYDAIVQTLVAVVDVYAEVLISMVYLEVYIIILEKVDENSIMEVDVLLVNQILDAAITKIVVRNEP